MLSRWRGLLVLDCSVTRCRAASFRRKCSGKDCRTQLPALLRKLSRCAQPSLASLQPDAWLDDDARPLARAQRPIQKKPKKQARRGQHTVNKHLLDTKLR
jgi:hypothetical protein